MYRRYLVIVATSLLAVSLGVALLLWQADPYRLYQHRGGDSREASADLFWHLRLHKPYALERVRPRFLVVGSSRAARLAPEKLANGRGSAYNAALPGISLREMARLLEHAQAVEPLDAALLTLDYYMFRASHVVEQHQDHRLRHVNPSLWMRLRHGWQRLLDSWRSLYSVDAAVDGWQNAAGRDSQRQFFTDGTWDAAVPAHRRGRPVYAMLARQKYGEFAQQDQALDFAPLATILAFANEQGIEITLLIAPLHALTLQAIAAAGGWDDYLDWQRALAEAVADWDGVKLYGLEANERLLHDPLTNPEPLFRDGVHFTRRVGDALLDCLALQQCDRQLQPVLLDAASIGGYLSAVERLRDAYAQSHPAEMAALQRWLASLGKEPPVQPAVLLRNR
jgi:hypothetical protein